MFLGALGVSALGAAGFGNLLLGPSSAQTGILVRSRVPLPRPYQVPLPIPAVLPPTSTAAGADHYLIRQRAALQEILPGLRTPILGYEGTFPGPTIVARSGRALVVAHRNELDVPTVVHLHGGHTPAASDGFPTDLVQPDPARVTGGAPATAGGHAGHTQAAPGLRDVSASRPPASAGSRSYEYPMTQQAATLWYHDHRMDHTARQVYHGLAGFHLVHDDEEAALPLPTGDRDVPLMIADRAFEEDGSFLYPDPPAAMNGGGSAGQPAMGGVLGDVVLVNGAPWPVLEVDAARYRLRLLNASNARRYLLRLSPARTPLVQIGSDAGLLPRPVELPDVDIAPGERYDVVVDFSAYPIGSTVDLVNDLGAGPTRDVMRFRITRRATGAPAVPEQARRRGDSRPRPRGSASGHGCSTGERRTTGRPGSSTGAASTLNEWTPCRDSAMSRSGGSPQTCGTPSTSTSTPSRSSPGGASHRAATTRAGRTPWTSRRTRSSRSRSASPTTPAATSCTATPSNMRTWG